MKNTIILFCSLLLSGALVAQAQDGGNMCSDRYNLPSSTTLGDCPTTVNQLCFDRCNGSVVPIEECELYSYCCNVTVGNVSSCAARTILFVQISASVDESNPIPNPFGNDDDDDSDDSDNSARNFNIGGGGQALPPNYQGGFPPFFPTQPPQYPHNCQRYYDPNALNSPINIPYCKRIACDPADPTLDNDQQRCLQQPGCYFDQELAQIRGYIGNQVLPRVPVCHLVIRNRAFRRLAQELVRALPNLPVWNPFYTPCILAEHQDEIFGPHCDCDKINLLEYFNFYPKRAGWRGINKQQCSLIGACWRTNPGQRPYCAYPVNNRGQPTIRSNNDQRLTGQNIAPFLYGLPECYPFSSNGGSADQFLSSYDTCLRAGCASSVDQNTLLQQLLSLGSGINPFNRYRYNLMVLNGQIRADNYKKHIESMRNQNANPFGVFSSPQPSRTCDPSALSVLYQNPFSTTHPTIFPTIPFPFPANPSILPNSFNFGNPGNTGNSGNFGSNFNGFPNNPFNPFITPQSDPCPYVQPNQLYPGVFALSGSFEDCCEKPLCYTPKPDLYEPWSGVSPYLSSWNCWSVCSQGCGGGYQNRTRVCVGQECLSSSALYQERRCNTPPCVIWSQWQSWAVCSTTCNSGIQTRTRSCDGGTECGNDGFEERSCNIGPCPVYGSTIWDQRCTPLNGNCGTGTRSGRRYCISNCKGAPQVQEQSQTCSVYCSNYYG